MHIRSAADVPERAGLYWPVCLSKKYARAACRQAGCAQHPLLHHMSRRQLTQPNDPSLASTSWTHAGPAWSNHSIIPDSDAQSWQASHTADDRHLSFLAPAASAAALTGSATSPTRGSSGSEAAPSLRLRSVSSCSTTRSSYHIIPSILTVTRPLQALVSAAYRPAAAAKPCQDQPPMAPWHQVLTVIRPVLAFRLTLSHRSSSSSSSSSRNALSRSAFSINYTIYWP